MILQALEGVTVTPSSGFVL